MKLVHRTVYAHSKSGVSYLSVHETLILKMAFKKKLKWMFRKQEEEEGQLLISDMFS